MGKTKSEKNPKTFLETDFLFPAANHASSA